MSEAKADVKVIGKVKLRAIVDAMPALSVFANTLAAGSKEKDTDKVMAYARATAKETYSVGKLVKKMNEEHQDYTESKKAALEKFGERRKVKAPGGDGEEVEALFVKDDKDNQAGFKKENDELLDSEVDLSMCVPIPWSYFEKVAVTPAVAADLADFMEAPPA